VGVVKLTVPCTTSIAVSAVLTNKYKY